MKRALALGTALLAFASLAAAQTVTRYATGPDPRGIVVDPITDKVYVANHGADYLTVFDAHTRTTKTITVGGGPEYLGFNPEVYGSPDCCNFLWVANTVQETASIVRMEDDTLRMNNVAVGAAGTLAFGQSVGPWMLRQYTVDEFMPLGNDRPGEVVHTGGAGVVSIAATRTSDNRDLVAIGLRDSSEVAFYLNQAVTRVAVPSAPLFLAIDPTKAKTFALGADGSITIIDNGTHATTTLHPAVATPANPVAIAVNPYTSIVYALYADRMVGVDPTTNATFVLASASAGSYSSIAIDPASNYVYLTQDGGLLEVYDPGINTTVQRITVAQGARRVAVNPTNRTVYVVGSQGTLDEVAFDASRTGLAPDRVTIDPLPGNASGTSGSVTVRFASTWAQGYAFPGAAFADVVPVGAKSGRFSRLGTQSYASAGIFQFDFTGLAPGDYEIHAWAYAAQPLGATSIATEAASVISTTPVATYRFTVTDRLPNAGPATMKRRVDFNGDGKEDVLLADLAGNHAAWLMNGTAIGAGGYPWTEPTTSRRTALVADLDGDGHSDVVTVDATGEVWFEYMSGTQVVREVRAHGVGSSSGGGFMPYAVGDFDGDGVKDILYRHPNFGYDVILYNADGSAKTTPVHTSSPLYPMPYPSGEVMIVADMNGDGVDDLVYGGNSPQIQYFLGSPSAIAYNTALTPPASGAVLSKVGDFDGDGTPDILWRGGDGAWYVSLMNRDGSVKSGGTLIGGGTGWEIVATIDLDGDGKTDLVWRGGDGSYAGWLMNGTAAKAYGSFLASGTGWELVSTADLDGDGKTDLLWRHDDGRIGEWMMNGLAARYYGMLLPAGTGWDLTP